MGLMMMFLSLAALCITISGAVLFTASFTSKKTEKDLEKFSPFECGFSPFQEFRALFSVHFLLLAMIFLVFDIELIILFPLFLPIWAGVSFAPQSALFFTGILSLGLWLEWSQKMLLWADYL